MKVSLQSGTRSRGIACPETTPTGAYQVLETKIEAIRGDNTTNRERFIDFIFLIVFFASGLVLLSLFFQALAWTPFLLSSATWNL